MIRKICIGVICSLFVLQAFQVVSTETINQNQSRNQCTIDDRIIFSKPQIVDTGEYISLSIEDASSYLMITGNPQIPIISRTYLFPFGTKIEDINVTFHGCSTQEIPKLLTPVSSPCYISTEFSHEISQVVFNEEVYLHAELYPSNQVKTRLGSGIINGERSIIVTVFLYPVQYRPLDNEIMIWEQAEISIFHTLPLYQPLTTDSYDLLILSPSEFASHLQPILTDKESQGIHTKLVSLDDIPQQGLDRQEDIKYYIKNAIEDWDISYVLLVGSGLRGDEKFPVRYAWVPSGRYEDNFPSDLYYADIYDGSGNLSTWDENGNGKYAEFPDDNASVDIYPDVYVGRLPCNNTQEVDLVVDKIITYMNENKMTKRIVQIGGDTFPNDPENINEGEYSNEQVMNYLSSYSSVQLWGSNGKLKRHNIILEILKGVDFVDFSGHGSYMSWATHMPGDEDQWIPKGLFYDGFVYVDTNWLVNFWKQPVIVLNACSCSKFSSFDSCLSWSFVKNKIGGGIASFGASGIGYGSYGSSETERLFGWMEVNLLRNLGQEQDLGTVWGTALTDYTNSFVLDEVDYKTLYELCLIGDPSLAITDA